MAKEFSMDIFNEIEKYFDSKSLKYKSHIERGIIETGTAIDCKLKNLMVYFNVFEESFIVNSVINISADEDSMSDVAEFITRVNYGLLHGNFELDYNDGEIQYKTSCYCSSGVPTYEDIEFCLMSNVITVERYGNALLSVIFGMATPEEAVNNSRE